MNRSKNPSEASWLSAFLRAALFTSSTLMKPLHVHATLNTGEKL